MCRRCGEPDRRPGAKRRKVITRRLLEIYGNGVICPCTWCGCLLGATPGRVHVRGTPDGIRGTYIPVQKLEKDRLMNRGPYSLWNLVPACGDCNKHRAIIDNVVPLGCTFGGRPRLDLAEAEVS